MPLDDMIDQITAEALAEFKRGVEVFEYTLIGESMTIFPDDDITDREILLRDMVAFGNDSVLAEVRSMAGARIAKQVAQKMAKNWRLRAAIDEENKLNNFVEQ